MIPVDPRAVAVLGGTFDPVHLGHVHVAEGVRRALGLSRVLLVPAASPPHKAGSRITPGEHRVAMLDLAVAGRSWLVVDRVELERGGVSYTIDTLRAIRARPERPLPVFVLGLDGLDDLPSWHRSDALVREFDLVVVARPGVDLQAVRTRLPDDLAARLMSWDAPPPADPSPLGSGGRIVHLPLPERDIASRDVRDRVASGRSIDALVPPPVRRYIHEYRLYRDDRAESEGSRREGGSTLSPEIAACIAAARDKKAEDLVVLDLRKSDFTDYLIICHGNNDRQIIAIADAIEQKLREQCGVRPSHVEGRRESNWILMDYIDFVVHVFDPDKRNFYRLERLWGDAPRIELPDEVDGTSATGAVGS